MRYLPFILLFALIVYALVDCVRYDEPSMPAGIPKGLWVVLIVVFPAAGAIAWLIVSRVHAHASAGRGAPSPYRQPPLQPRRRPVIRQVAPDDDPEFLASLGRRDHEEQTPPATDGTDEASIAGPSAREEEPSSEESTDEGPADRDEDEGSPGRPGTPPAA